MIKRIFDVLMTLTILVLLSPVIVVVTLAIAWKLGTPIFFVQQRTGKAGVPFKMVKFRTMTSETDANGALLPNTQRMTRFGNVLRSTSLDELPELVNVLMGKMSLVGPRPLLTAYDELYSDNHARRLDVPPGITGWAQVNGRNSSTWNARLDLDVWYVDNHSLLLDIKILFMTVYKVLKRDDVLEPDQIKRFEGYDE